MNDKLNDAMNHIGDMHLYESIRPRRFQRHWIVLIVVALLALALFLVPILVDRMRGDAETQPTSSAVEPLHAKIVYCEMETFREIKLSN